jgi:N-acetyl sugar amidotransferase
MRYCNVCLTPSTRPGEKFSADGLCLGCLNFQKINQINYYERLELLEELIKKYPRKNTFFDCILGVSGGKDSTRQAIYLREKLGLNPLLVCMTWPPEQVNIRGVNNLSNLINLGFDLVLQAPAPNTFKKLMRESFLNFANWAKSTELALYSSVPQVAIAYGISLIFNGEDPGQKEAQSMGLNGWDNNKIINNNTLSGGDVEWMKSIVDNPSKLIPYQFPGVDILKKNDIQIVDLGWFLGDWSFYTNGVYAVSLGMDPRKDEPAITGDPSYVSCLDEDWVSVNQLIKYYKYGFGKATDYVNEEIRFGRLTREQGIDLIKEYDGACHPVLIQTFCDYIEISVEFFWQKVRSVTNIELFECLGPQKFRPKFQVGICST